MRFGVLGAVEVRTDAGAPVRVPELKVRLLLAHLLLHAGEVVSVDALVDRLWERRPPADPKATVQAKVSQLRKVLEDAEPGGRDLVASEPPGYRLAVREDAVDAGRFTALLERARTEADPRSKAALADDALAWWRGRAFADLADSLTAHPAQARLDELWLVATEERAEAMLALGEHALLVGELDELAALHPLRERLRAAQMRALYLAGRANDALGVFTDVRTRLRDELGADPAPELVDLHRAILEHNPELRPEPPASGIRAALPQPAGELLGRDGDVARLRVLCGQERLVTLVGIGGVGKTRLALAAARECDGRLPDGARLVELDALPATGPDAGRPAVGRVAEVVLQAFGGRAGASAGHAPGGTREATERVCDAVRAVDGLLVLDNCEHVVGAVAALVPALLRAGAGLRVLATSREPLDLAGEVLHPVEPLSTDGAAVALFAARARAADPGFVLDERTEPEVRAVCARLDGIPLALELAAARVRALGLAGLAERLDDRFAVLAGHRRDAPDRQRTLRATIDWSWWLLDDADRAVLRRLAVFSGGATLAATEDVCAGAPVSDVLDTVARLVDRSLVTRTPAGRYRMTEAVSAYAAERLVEAGEPDATHERHLAYFLRLAEQGAPQLRGREQRDVLDRLDAEAANLRAALSAAEQAGRADDALRMVSALAWYWFLRGRPGEALTAADTALAVPGGDDTARARVRVWRAGLAFWSGGDHELAEDGVRALDALPDGPELAWGRWFLAFTQWGIGDVHLAAGWVEAALPAFRAAGDTWGQAVTLATRSAYATLRDDLEAARRDARRAAELFASLGDRWGRLQALDSLATVAEVTGDYPEAARQQAAGLRIAEDLALWPEISGRLSGLGRISMLDGDLDTACAQHERARSLGAELGNTPLVDYAEFGLALVARRRGDLETAEELLLPWLDREGETAGFAALTPLAELGFIAELRGDGERALALHRAGYQGAVHSGGGRAVALALEGLAGAFSIHGAPERAAGLLGAADAARRAAGAPLPPGERGDVDRISERLRGQLGGEAFAREFAAGARREPADLVSAG